MNAVARARPRTIGESVAWAETGLAAITDTPRFEAELLLAECTGLNRAGVMAHPEQVLTDSQLARLIEAVGRRARGEPFAYIVGRREFFGLEFAVGTDVLVPRPETELLVEQALELVRPGAHLLDLGTGSGAIALAIKAQRPDLTVVATDCSEAALAVACRNAETLGLDVRCVLSDWFAALAGDRFDLIVSNPPYVPSADPHFATAISCEPRLALDGGADGLDACRAILVAAGEHLEPGGKLLLEHGFDQRDALVRLADQFGFELITAFDDLAGQPRCIELAIKGHG